MIRVKERLKQYRNEYSKYSKYDGLLVSDVMDMLEQLQDDLEHDEKQNNWIPVTERMPEVYKESCPNYVEENENG